MTYAVEINIYIRAVTVAVSAVPTPRKTPEQLDQEAVWLRAESRRLEAQAEYEIKVAELAETRRLLGHKPELLPCPSRN